MARQVTCIRARTSDRTPAGGRGAEALARRLGGAVVGEAPDDPRPRDWSEDLPDAAPALRDAREAVRRALEGGDVPLLTASDCTICLATFPEVARQRPDARFLWIDAHGDFNTPETTPSGFLGGMCLAGACGVWDAGWDVPVDPHRVSFYGVRELDPGEREEVKAAGVARGVPDGPVFAHLDVDALDPSMLPCQFPVAHGLAVVQLREALAGLDLVGLEVTAFEAPEDAAELDRRTALVAGLLP